MDAAPSPTGSPSRRPLWFALGAVGVLLIVALIVVLVVWRGGAATPSSDGTAAGGRATPTATADPVPVSSAVPDPAAGPRPTSCDEIYSPDMLATFTQTHSPNPAWTETAEAATRMGTLDPDLSALIESADHLSCVWADPEGGSGSGLVTNVVFVTAEQSTAARERLTAMGQTCYDELEGLRCVIETDTDGDGVAGESHFLRDGIWLATSFVNAGPDGYTHDIVATIWAGE
jgi:hypothetical protein